MITDARLQGDLIAALHLESLFKSDYLGTVGAKSNHATYAEPAIHYPHEHNGSQLRHRLEFIKMLAVTAQGLSMETDTVEAGTREKRRAATLRAATNVATWRTYLPEDCVVAMVNSGWHRST